MSSIDLLDVLYKRNDEDEETKFEEEVLEIMRSGSYVGDAKPIKIRLKTQFATEILARTFRLKDCEDY